MKRLAFFLAVLVAPALPAVGGALTGRALVGYNRYEYDSLLTDGLRQTYDLRLSRAISDATRFQLTFRADDFSGSVENDRARLNSSTRTLQPSLNLNVEVGDVHASVTGDVIDTQADIGGALTGRRLQRSRGELSWEPERLPSLLFMGQHNAIDDKASATNQTDDFFVASARYEVRGLQLSLSEQYNGTVSPSAGYDRSTQAHSADVQYTTTGFSGRAMLSAQAGARLSQLRQQATSNAPSSVPNPVAIVRASSSIDDTPTDGTDHPLVPAPSLIDGDLNRSSGISLGPDGVSFQNLAIDLGRLERVDEIRIIVRDAVGDPLRRGGGPVTWDVYTSTDGFIWTQIPSVTSSFNGPQSYYTVSFTLDLKRFYKVVNFGVNSEATFVTEVQGYYHTTIAPGTTRNTDQDNYIGALSTWVQPTKKLSLSYSGLYNSFTQSDAATGDLSSTDFAHLGFVEYDFARDWTVRGEYRKSEAGAVAGASNSTDGYTSYLDYAPTQQLHLSAEYGRDDQTLGDSSFTLETYALHTTALVIRSLNLVLDIGTQDQIFEDGSAAHRKFENLSANAQLSRTWTARLAGSLQESETESDDPATQLLGPERDNRATLDLMWHPGERLAVTGRLGYARGTSLSGFTHKYHVEWFPFGDGTVTLSASYDEDIDPATGRRGSRVIFNPRWAMNRHATFDLNYTAVSSTDPSGTRQQRTAFATLTLSK